YRPPYGVLNATALAVCAQRGWEPVLWTRWGRDWRARATVESVATEVTRDLTGGEVLLLHDADRYSAPGSWHATLGALPAIVATVRARGLELRRLDEGEAGRGDRAHPSERTPRT
ncbi:MAG: polysaccharide deacetylase family protein, partial [Conexibacter sp.]|nr:polysaccharide deacetylase family protein [Conexibacter sp.]